MRNFFCISRELRKLYKSQVSDADVITTVDHVYASPPTRLMDSHRMAQSINADVLVITSNKPDRHKYRYDLILDSGIYASNNANYHLFPSNLRYFSSQVSLPNFPLQRESLLKTLTNLSGAINANEAEAYVRRFDDLVNIYTKIIEINRESSSSFYVNLLRELYILFGANDISEYIKERAMGLHNSKIATVYIPAVIKETAGRVYGLEHLITNGIIKKKCYVTNNDCEFYVDQIAEALIRKEVVPNYQLVLWASSLAGIKHFGNDMNFHEQLAKYYRQQGVETKIENLQLTGRRNDGIAFAQFIDTYCYHLNKAGTNVHPVKTKPSRINNLCNLYCHMGESVQSQWQYFMKTKIPIGLSMRRVKV